MKILANKSNGSKNKINNGKHSILYLLLTIVTTNNIISQDKIIKNMI